MTAVGGASDKEVNVFAAMGWRGVLVTAIAFTSGATDPHLVLQDRRCGQRNLRRHPILTVTGESSDSREVVLSWNVKTVPFYDKG